MLFQSKQGFFVQAKYHPLWQSGLARSAGKRGNAENFPLFTLCGPGVLRGEDLSTFSRASEDFLAVTSGCQPAFFLKNEGYITSGCQPPPHACAWGFRGYYRNPVIFHRSKFRNSFFAHKLLKTPIYRICKTVSGIDADAALRYYQSAWRGYNGLERLQEDRSS